jgi:hypothetical protein
MLERVQNITSGVFLKHGVGQIDFSQRQDLDGVEINHMFQGVGKLKDVSQNKTWTFPDPSCRPGAWGFPTAFSGSPPAKIDCPD